MRSWSSRTALRNLHFGVVALALLALLTTLTSSVPAAGASKKLGASYYVSLGDSYAEGVQPGYADNSETLSGYSNRVVTDALAHGHKLLLENFGCGGATTRSLLYSVGCAYPALNAPAYPTTSQANAALSFLRHHKGLIGLITISIGGNNFDSCIGQPPSCVQAAMPLMLSQIKLLSAKLRAAVGYGVPIIGLSYPDVEDGLWLLGGAEQQAASESQTTFEQVITPTFEAAYAPLRVSFIDEAKDLGTETPFSSTTTLAPYGTVPTAVADACELTWICAKENIHPTAAGYAAIAQLITTKYLALVKNEKN